MRLRKPLSECLRPRSREEAAAEFEAHMKAQPFPQYHPISGAPGGLERIDADGHRTVGKVVGGAWTPVDRK